MTFFHIVDVGRERAARDRRYYEFLRVPAMSAGVYVLAAGATDQQKPHHEDELYYVVRGRARMKIGPGRDISDADLDETFEDGSDNEVRAGSIIFVKAERGHRFYDIQEELEVLVFFAPAEQE
ncbi:MAG: hypothetical protein ABSG70_16720 [Terriglobales bacterium]|jgi:mannose-6-phosphate isomerase-like protein (cupin superfamily)